MNTLFKKFNIIAVIKKTEFSSVYLADHVFLEKRIILKTLQSDKVLDKSDLHRFQREARILAKLDHPNIIQVLDYGTFENFVYISFEYFEAQTLRQLINSDVKLNNKQKTDVLKQAIAGLDYAHSNNIIHRDIKPENILINSHYALKIADFGLALSDESRVLTDPKAMLGTPAYASPEQVSGIKLSPASDLFALGLVAFELFNNYNPVLGKDVSQTINNIINFDQESYNTLISKTAEKEKAIIKNLLNPEPALRKIPAELYEDNAHVLISRRPLMSKILGPVAAVAILTLLIYYNWFSNISGNNSPLEKREMLFTDTLITKKESPVAQLPETTVVKPVAEAKAIQKQAFLHITVTPPAMLYINSKKYGGIAANQDEIIELASGSYNIQFTRSDFPDYQQVIELKAGEQKVLHIDLAKESGVLEVFTFPWAVIEINDKNYGQTPLEQPIRLKKGTYRMRLKNPGFDIFQKTFKINGADTILIQHNFVNPGLGTIIE